MSDLITMLEQADCGSRELDAATYEALGRPWDDDPREYSFLTGWDCPPPYSTSLDAALSALPEGWLPEQMSWSVEGSPVVASIWNRQNGDAYRSCDGEAKTPALALITAILKATREAGE